MKNLVSVITIVAASVGLAGCISTQEMPLAPNIVRIDTQARGLLFTGQTVPATMRAAAKATLDRGYTHFQFADAGVQQGSVVAGAVASSNTNYNGTYGRGSFSGTSNSLGTASVIHAPTSGAAATVIMFHANEPGAQNAFEAQQVLKQYQ
ncbi:MULTISPECIES: hypothetical protein [Rhodopseudomonas]|uniref:Lipoprotein n=1 Tax=Rhodopseudomonas palustris TaxID=1076 RepID=A0A0D7E5I3_RHOPL|nr:MULTISPECIES: hypothetical protein [Rhodopseudomonas]KIZ34837.1 hypothetical protein OO17_26360 [Rhodopseudomonas palustris]MDF3810694.1 hypothetical protein [Rhodopseudomonas sp. BAL398]WOK18484.1 hypothetical protein RBJ75_02845 [Rhodopseudomonas sp. BAL398]